MERALEVISNRVSAARQEAEALVGKVDAVGREAGRVVERAGLTPVDEAIGSVRALVEAARGRVASLTEAANQATDVADRLVPAASEPAVLDTAVNLTRTAASEAEAVVASVEAVPAGVQKVELAAQEAAARAVELPIVSVARASSEALRSALIGSGSAADGRDTFPGAVTRAQRMARETVAALATLRDQLANSARPEPIEELSAALPAARTATAAAIRSARAMLAAATAARTAVEQLSRPGDGEGSAKPAEVAVALRTFPALVADLGEKLGALAAGLGPLDRALAAPVDTSSLGTALRSAQLADESLSDAARLLAPSQSAPLRAAAPPASAKPPNALGRQLAAMLPGRAGEGRDRDAVAPRPAIERAGLLIRYAAERAIDLRGVDLVAILSFRETLNSEKNPTAYEEERFWRAYAGLVSAVRPASPDSIRERAEFERGGRPLLLTRATRRFRRAMLFSLLVALGVSWYYSALDAPIQRASSARQVFADAQTTLVLARAQAAAAAAPASGSGGQPVPTAAEVDARVNDQARVTARRAMCGAVVDWRSSLDYLGENRPGELPGHLAGAVTTLVRSALNVPLGVIGRPLDPTPGAPAVTGEGGTPLEDGKGPPTPPVPEGERLRDEVCRQGLVDVGRLVRLDLGEASDFVLLEEAKGWRDRIATYLLPLFYGLLGSLAHIVRSLRDDIVNVTFTLGSYTTLTVRWLLGALAGVTIGLAVQPETLTSLQGITQLGIAFLAGYSVDLLFNFLDRFQLTQPRRSGAEASGTATTTQRTTP